MSADDDRIGEKCTCVQLVAINKKKLYNFNFTKKNMVLGKEKLKVFVTSSASFLIKLLNSKDRKILFTFIVDCGLRENMFPSLAELCCVLVRVGVAGVSWEVRYLDNFNGELCNSNSRFI